MGCVNQKDIKERGQQVTLMGKVYSRCRECFIWLGEEDDFPQKYKPIPNTHLPETAETFATFEKYIQSNNIHTVTRLPAKPRIDRKSGRSSLDVEAGLAILPNAR